MNLLRDGQTQPCRYISTESGRQMRRAVRALAFNEDPMRLLSDERQTEAMDLCDLIFDNYFTFAKLKHSDNAVDGCTNETCGSVVFNF